MSLTNINVQLTNENNELKIIKNDYNILIKQNKKEKEASNNIIQNYETNINDTIKNLKDYTDELELKLSKAYDEIKILKLTMKNKNIEITVLNMLIKQENEQINQLELNLTQDETILKDTKPKLAMYINKNKMLNKQIKDLFNELHISQDKITNLQQEIVEINQKHRDKITSLMIDYTNELLIEKNKLNGHDNLDDLFDDDDDDKNGQQQDVINEQDDDDDDSSSISNQKNKSSFLKKTLKDLNNSFNIREHQLITTLNVLHEKVINITEDREELTLMLIALQHSINELPLELKDQYNINDINVDNLPETIWTEKEELINDYEEKIHQLSQIIIKLKYKLSKQLIKSQDDLNNLQFQHNQDIKNFEQIINQLKEGKGAGALNHKNNDDDDNYSEISATTTNNNIMNLSQTKELIRPISSSSNNHSKIQYLQEEILRLKRTHLNSKELLKTQKDLLKKEKEYQITEAALNNRIKNLLPQIDKLKMIQHEYIEKNNPNIAKNIELEYKSIKNNLKDFQINIQNNLELELLEVKSKLSHTQEELRVYREYLKITLLKYNKQINKLQNELRFFKSLQK